MIPEEWELRTLQDCGITVIDGDRGKEYPSSDDFFDEGYCLFLSAKNVTKAGFVFDDCQFINETKHKQLRKGSVQPGDLVLTTRGTVGNVGYLRDLNGFGAVRINSGMVVVRNSQKCIETDFLHALFRSPVVEKQIERMNFGSAQPQLTVKIVNSLKLPIPPVRERQRITGALETWDRAIVTVEALIANARAQKQALMQQLLPQGTTPPKKRLPGFSGEWKRVALADIGTISSAGVDKNIVEGEAEVRLLNFLDAYNREFIYDSDLNHRVTAPIAKVQGCDVRKGDVFFTPSSETRDDIALAAVAVEDMPGVVYSYHVVRFRPTKKLDLKFCAFLFQTDDFKRQAYRLGDGSGQRYVISQSNFRKMLVSLPSIDEQAAIGALLADHSTIIADYEAQLATLRQEKAALMQQLLTGKRRVNIPESEVA